MGHRALVARERADGRHDLHRSQWGGADMALARTLDVGPWPPEVVEDTTQETGVTWTALLAAHLDPLLHEALFVATRDGDVRAYRPLWLGADPADPRGLLVAVRWADPCDDARVLAWFEGARAVTRDGAAGGTRSTAEAATLVERRLRAWAGDREVIRVPSAALA